MLKRLITPSQNLMRWLGTSLSRKISSLQLSEQSINDQAYAQDRALLSAVVAKTSSGSFSLTQGKFATPQDVQRRYQRIDEMEQRIQARERSI